MYLLVKVGRSNVRKYRKKKMYLMFKVGRSKVRKDRKKKMYLMVKVGRSKVRKEEEERAKHIYYLYTTYFTLETSNLNKTF